MQWRQWGPWSDVANMSKNQNHLFQSHNKMGWKLSEMPFYLLGTYWSLQHCKKLITPFPLYLKIRSTLLLFLITFWKPETYYFPNEIFKSTSLGLTCRFTVNKMQATSTPPGLLLLTTAIWKHLHPSNSYSKLLFSVVMEGQTNLKGRSVASACN